MRPQRFRGPLTCAIATPDLPAWPEILGDAFQLRMACQHEAIAPLDSSKFLSDPCSARPAFGDETFETSSPGQWGRPTCDPLLETDPPIK